MRPNLHAALPFRRRRRDRGLNHLAGGDSLLERLPLLTGKVLAVLDQGVIAVELVVDAVALARPGALGR